MIDFDYHNVTQKPDKIFGVVFRGEVFSEIAKTIIEHIKKKGCLSSYETREIINDNGFASNSFYKVLRRMLKLGMLYKIGGKYRISKEFGNAMNRLYKAWRKLLEEI